LITARNRAPSHDGRSMWFMLAIVFVALCETGRGNLGEVENTGWEGQEWSVFIFEASKVIAPACVD
jgi:hypothetical protein